MVEPKKFIGKELEGLIWHWVSKLAKTLTCSKKRAFRVVSFIYSIFIAFSLQLLFKAEFVVKPWHMKAQISSGFKSESNWSRRLNGFVSPDRNVTQNITRDTASVIQYAFEAAVAIPGVDIGFLFSQMETIEDKEPHMVYKKSNQFVGDFNPRFQGLTSYHLLGGGGAPSPLKNK